MSERKGGRFQKRHKGNDGGRARHSSRTGAGAPVPTPCSPRARRFRRARPLSCTPCRAGAADTATAAAPAASVAAMATAGSHATVRLPAPPYRCPRRPFWAAVVVGIARSRWYRTDVPPAAAFQAHASSCRLRACIPRVKHNEHAACGLSSPQISAGRGRFCARVASELLDARLPSECARAERYFGAHGRLTPVRDQCQRETA